MRLTRRAAIAAALAAPSVARAQAPAQMRVSTAAIGTDWLARALEEMKGIADRARPGRLAIAIHPNGTLFRQGTEVPALQRGNLEMSTMTTFEVEQQLPEYGVMSAGYLFRDPAHMRAVMEGGIGRAYAADVAARMGIEILATVYLGTRHVTLRQRREVRTPADLAGVKLRMPPGPGWTALAQGLGVTPTAMAMPEVYLAMKTGAVDGQENPLGIARANNLQEVSQTLVLTAHMVQPVFLAVAKPWFDRLDPLDRAALRAAAAEAARFNDRGRLAEEAGLLDVFRAAGVSVAEPDRAAFAASVAARYEAAGLAQRWKPGLAAEIAAVA